MPVSLSGFSFGKTKRELGEFSNQDLLVNDSLFCCLCLKKGDMQIQNRLSVEKCRELVDNHQQYSDSELLGIRDKLYRLAEVVVQKFEEIKSFVTQTKTIAAKARIVQ